MFAPYTPVPVNLISGLLLAWVPILIVPWVSAISILAVGFDTPIPIPSESPDIRGLPFIFKAPNEPVEADEPLIFPSANIFPLLVILFNSGLLPDTIIFFQLGIILSCS